MPTSSPPSGSEATEAYDLLHPEVRRWVRDQGWAGLREIQSRAILQILRGERDVLVAASTAAGKTEAAFLPILSRVAAEPAPGLAVLYVAPLKALINDQANRLESLGDRLDLPVVRWHGDAPDAAKQKLLARPRGVALITPESIEALLCRRPAAARGLFRALRFIVVDELHAFLAGPRGIHFASLLRRVDAMAAGTPRRIGLSATLGDLNAAATWLRPAEPSRVCILRAAPGGGELQLQVRGYIEPQKPSDAEGAPDLALNAITDHLMATLRGTNSLVFGGSRQRVEMLADMLRGRCEQAGLPNEFFPHHGNLSRDLREEVEGRLKAGGLPTTAVCTSTLELGIDIGSVTAVSQFGAPRSISSLRQRLGRSGRRPGMPAVLRVYVAEEELDADPDPLDELRQETVRAVAAIRLLGAGFLESPGGTDGLGSALLHQTLSVICERGGARAETIHGALCGPGPFAAVPKPLFLALLRNMGSPQVRLIEQAPDGTLMLGPAGERLTASRDFYALFASPEEWRVVAGGRTLGSLPVGNPLMAGNLIVFAGRRWIVREVDDAEHVIVVEAHSGGRAPAFNGTSGEAVDDRLAAELLAVYLADDTPSWIDGTAAALLAAGRSAFRRHRLDTSSVIQTGGAIHLLTWRGSRSNGLLSVLLAADGFQCWAHDCGVSIFRPDVRRLMDRLASLQTNGVPDLERVAADVEAIASGKFDNYLSRDLLRAFWALSMRDVAANIGMALDPIRLADEGTRVQT